MARPSIPQTRRSVAFRVRALLAFALALPAAGCSFLLTSGPMEHLPRDHPAVCRGSALAPLLDAAWAAYALAATHVEKSGGISTEDAALGGIWIASAAWGVYNLARCSGREGAREAADEARSRYLATSTAGPTPSVPGGVSPPSR